MAPFPKFVRFTVTLALGLSACRATDTADTAIDASTQPDGNFAYPEPRSDLVPKAGSDATLEIATWNIENFPKRESTPKTVADIITSLDIDMIALQEIEDIAAFEEVVERLRGYEGVLSGHIYGNGNYQKVGYIFRKDLISMSGTYLLFQQDGYEFPRPGLKVDVHVNNGADSFDFTAIALHLKAGGGVENRSRREAAVVILENHLRATVDGPGNSSIVVLGDYNDTLEQNGVWGPLNDGSRYTIRTEGNNSANQFSFVPFESLIDHQVTTSDFDQAHPGGDTIIPRLDTQLTGYESQVSDHLPVIMRFPL
ncbi:MAG: endonuclease/exonuclease/phosphatase family protein [Kofleriaceae bacterium]|nr:endonuclease/exonuclease/phosphatase family protein [Kofleriaceae bacterium]